MGARFGPSRRKWAARATPTAGPARHRVGYVLSAPMKPGNIDRADLAWLAAVPAALLTVAAMAILGAPLGRAIFPTSTTVSRTACVTSPTTSLPAGMATRPPAWMS